MQRVQHLWPQADSCYRAQERCLICGAYDHHACDCPYSHQQAPLAPPKGQGQRGRGRRRGPPHQLAEESLGDLVEGILPLFGYSARVLVDSGASHSFVFEQFASLLGQFCEFEDLEMKVATPGGKVLPPTHCFYGVDVEIAGRCLPADLRVLKMVDYNVIFDMDCLRRFRTHV